MKHHCHKFFILPIELKNDRGATVCSSEVSDLTIKVWTQSPDFSLVFHADDLKDIDGTEALSIPTYFMAALPAGAVVYEYRFFTEGNPREIKHRTVTNQIWKRELPLSYYEELNAFREMVKENAGKVDEAVSDVKGTLDSLENTVKAITERDVNFLVNEKESVKLNGYENVDIYVAPPLQAQVMELLSIAGRKKMLSISADFSDIMKEIEGNVADNIIGGAPKAYDTLKEIADYIEEHEEVTDALNAAVGSKADKQEVEALKNKTQFAERAFVTGFNTTVSTPGGLAVSYSIGNIASVSLSSGSFSIPNATTSSAGVMSPKDKSDLDYLMREGARRTDLAQLKSDLLGDDLEATFNTLKEVQDWADEHGTEYAELVQEVGKKAGKEELEEAVFGKEVVDETTMPELAKKEQLYNRSGEAIFPVVSPSDLDRAKVALFDDMWVALDGIIVDKQRHIYGLNGLDNITYEQAVAILEKANFAGLPNTNLKTVVIRGCRTNFPPSTSQEIVSLNNCGCDATVEVLALIPNKATIMCNGFSGFVNNAPSLREIHGIINVNNVTNVGTSYLGCPELTYFRITNLGCNLNLSRCPKLDIESFNYLVQHSDKTKTFTVTVHEDVYAKLTDEGNAEWHKVLTDALERNISFATA